MAEYEVSLDQPNRPKGDPIEVPPVGVVENGSKIKVELSREEAEILATGYGITVKTSSGSTLKAKVIDVTNDVDEGGETE